MGGQRHAPAAVPPGRKPGTHRTRGWVGPGPIWTGGKNCALRGIRYVQSIASKYTDQAILANFHTPLEDQLFSNLYGVMNSGLSASNDAVSLQNFLNVACIFIARPKGMFP